MDKITTNSEENGKRLRNTVMEQQDEKIKMKAR